MLSARGVASRRRAEALIRAGRVTVDGRVVTELGTKVDPRSAVIRVDDRVYRAQPLRYLLLNKPIGYITTTRDEHGRRSVMDLIHANERVYPVGRLDRDTEGLLLLTNDGEVANRVSHPRHGLAKEYNILTPRKPSDRVQERVRQGIDIDGRLVVPLEFRILRETRDGVLLTITVREGLNRVVRRMMEAVNIPIARLRRVRIGPLSLAGIEEGRYRPLNDGELVTLMQAVRLHDAVRTPTSAHVRPTDAAAGHPARSARRAPRPRASNNASHRQAPPQTTTSAASIAEQVRSMAANRTGTDTHTERRSAAPPAPPADDASQNGRSFRSTRRGGGERRVQRPGRDRSSPRSGSHIREQHEGDRRDASPRGRGRSLGTPEHGKPASERRHEPRASRRPTPEPRREGRRDLEQRGGLRHERGHNDDRREKTSKRPARPTRDGNGPMRPGRRETSDRVGSESRSERPRRTFEPPREGRRGGDRAPRGDRALRGDLPRFERQNRPASPSDAPIGRPPDEGDARRPPRPSKAKRTRRDNGRRDATDRP